MYLEIVSITYKKGIATFSAVAPRLGFNAGWHKIHSQRLPSVEGCVVIEKYHHIRYALFPKKRNQANCWTFAKKILEENGKTIDDFEMFGGSDEALSKSFKVGLETNQYLRQVPTPIRLDLALFERGLLKETSTIAV